MQLEYDVLAPISVVELTCPVPPHESAEPGYELVEDDDIIEMVAELDDPWFANDGDDIDDGVYWAPLN